MKRTKRIWALMLTLLTTLCLLPGAAMAEGEHYCYLHRRSTVYPDYYTYYQRSIHRSLDKSPDFGPDGGNILPAVYLLYEGEIKDNPTKVYCCDAATSVLPNEADKIQYRRLTLENAGYYSADNAKKIRAIAKTSYPFVTKDEMVKTLAEHAPDGGIVLNGVTAHPLSTGTSGAVDVLLRFELKNDRHGGITLDEKDVLTLTANNQIFPCSEWKNEGNGTYSVMLQGVTAGENIDVAISGEQYLARDAYFYEPVSGRHAAQCFVGVAEGMTPVFARGSFRIDEKTERLAYLSVKKTSNRAGTYKFNVYKAENDTKELINTVEITTAEANTCVASEKILLPAGTYIVEEEDAIKAGYTLIVTVDGKEHTVNSEKVENPSVQVTLKENSEAEVTVNFANCYEEIPSSFGFKKTDEHDAGVKGAVFALFKDEDCKEPTAYKQTSDSNGDVKFPLIPVGIYYMKETAAPYGYYLNKEVFKIEVLVQEASGTDNVAIYRKDAQDQWVKVEGSLEVENSRKPEKHYTPEEPVPAIVVMPKTGDGSVLLSAAGLLLAAAAVCGLERRIRG